MPTVNKQRIQIAMVAGETSGDQLAAGLINSIRSRFPNSSFIGVGGPRMAAAGCKLLFDMERISVIGLDGLFAKLPGIFHIKRTLRKRFIAERPDVFVGVDAPDFNLSLARKLKHDCKQDRNRIACVQYVSPTVWAWRGYRIHKIRRSIDHMLTLFPFEAGYYQQNNVPVTCVGHPMADEISTPDRARARKQLGFSNELGLLIALLPGSRRSEIKRLANTFMDSVRRILEKYPHAKFVLPFANNAVAKEFHNLVGDLDGLPVHTIDGNARLALEACDVAILASGTAALEAALLRRPHIVVYKLAAFSYWLMRRLRHVEHYSMPNQLLPAPIIPELIQRNATAENIAREVDTLLKDDDHRADLERQFAELHQQLKLDASRGAGDAVLKLAGASIEDIKLGDKNSGSASVAGAHV